MAVPSHSKWLPETLVNFSNTYFAQTMADWKPNVTDKGWWLKPPNKFLVK